MDKFSCGCGFATYVPQEMFEKPNISGGWGVWKQIYTLFPIIQPSHLCSADEKSSPPKDSSCSHCEFAVSQDAIGFPQGARISNGSAETTNDFRTSKYFTLFICRFPKIYTLTEIRGSGENELMVDTGVSQIFLKVETPSQERRISYK